MGFNINWNVTEGDSVLRSPQYQKYSQYTFGELTPPVVEQIKNDIQAARSSRESAAVINYLVWLLRTVALLA